MCFDEIGELDAPCQRNLLGALPDGDLAVRRGVLTSAFGFDDQSESE